jgi:sec-independent protein translocase protein TatC
MNYQPPSANANDLEKMPLMQHFRDLIKVTRRSFYWLVAACAVTYVLAEKLVFLLKLPMERAAASFSADRRPEVIITRPFEEIWTYLQVSLYLGIFVALPFILYEISSFVAPGLRQVERKRIRTLVLSAYIVFIFGCYLSYTFALEAVLQAVITYGGGMQLLKWTLSSYISTVVGVILAFAILLEIPLLMIYLSRWNWVSPTKWAQGRKVAIVINAALSALLSPPDILSMFVVLLPMQILYEVGVVLSKLLSKNVDQVGSKFLAK